MQYIFHLVFDMTNYCDWRQKGGRRRPLLELPELVKVFCGLDGRLEEGALLVPAQGEPLQYLVQANLVFAVDGEQEPAELVLEIVRLAEVLVAALFVLLEEVAAECRSLAGGCPEAHIHVVGAESAGPHRGSDATTRERVGVVGGVAHEGQAVERVVLERAGNRHEPANGMVDLCPREEFFEPFHRDFENVARMLARGEEPCAEVRDV